MKKKIPLFLLMFLSVNLALAQTRKITGRVVADSSRQSLSGVTVAVKGGEATVTNKDGRYSILVPDKGKVMLVFTSIGYITKEVMAENKNVVDVSMFKLISSLDDVVVIGYGTTRRKDLTGTVSSIGGAQLEKIPVSNAAEAITGRLPGVQVVTSDGEPGADISIRVRGGTSITGSNEPLYIVDGFRVNNINDIAPSDIASIDVLKDAATTAIYGAAGANGVIIVTTKAPRYLQKTTITYNGYVTGRTLARKLKVLSPYEYVLLQYENARLNNNLDDFTKKFGVYDDLELYKYQKGTDWQDELFGKTVYSQQQSLNVSGGNDKTKVSLSLSYNKDNGQKPPNYLDRKYLNLKLNHEISRKLKMDFGLRYANTNVNGAGTSGSSNFKIKDAITTRPVNGIADFIAIDPAASDDDLYEQFRNDALRRGPSQLNKNDYRKREIKVFNFNTAVNWAVAKNMTFRTELGYDFNWGNSRRYYDTLTTMAKSNGGLPVIDIGGSYANSYRLTNTFNINNLLNNNDHIINLLAGQEILTMGRGYNQASTLIQFPKEMPVEKTFASLAQGTTLTQQSNDLAGAKVASFFGRAGYQLNGKYIFNFTGRYDGTTRFAPGKQWGFFPAASAAWRISSEKFMQNMRFLNDLKLRVSYGAVGNNNIEDDLYRTLFVLSNSAPYGAGNTPQVYYNYASSTLSNPDLRWETTITRNIGLDFTLLQGKLSGTVDVYHNTTKDLLVKSAIPSSTGFSVQQQNIGQTSNRGVEVSFTGNVLNKRDFQLNFNFNISFNHFKIDALDGVNERTYSSGWAGTDLRYQDDYRVIVDQGIGLMYGFVTDGIYTPDEFTQSGSSYKLLPGIPDPSGMNAIAIRPGSLKLKDLNEDGIIDENDRAVIGHGQPKFIGGFGLNAALFRNFDVSAFFNFSYGNDVYNAGKLRFNMQYRSTYLNMLNSSNYENRFHFIDGAGNLVTDLAELTKLNPNPKIWSPFSISGTGPVFHSWAVEDGSFLRLNTVSIGYTLPAKLTRKAFINKLRIYLTAYNAYLWTHYSGYDPEVNTLLRTDGGQLKPGFDESAYPRSRNFTAGVNVTF